MEAPWGTFWFFPCFGGSHPGPRILSFFLSKVVFNRVNSDWARKVRFQKKSIFSQKTHLSRPETLFSIKHDFQTQKRAQKQAFFDVFSGILARSIESAKKSMTRLFPLDDMKKAEKSAFNSMFL